MSKRSMSAAAKASSVLAAVFAMAAVVMAQRETPRLDPKHRANLALNEKNLGRASSLVAKAREALRKSRFDEAEKLCDQAIYIYQVVSEDLAAPAHEVLAESFVARKRYSEALVEIRLVDRNQGTRSRMTQALALIGLNRQEEATKLIAEEIGTAEKAADLRSEKRLWSLPIDRTRSRNALIATALIVRSASNETSPEDALVDLDRASRLVPNDATIELKMGDSLFALMRYGDAIPYFVRAGELGEGRTAKAAKKMHVRSLQLKAAQDEKKAIQGGG